MDKYTKLQKIGQGSFGSAYLATKKNDPSQKYVIKEIRMDPRDQQTALREAKLLAALDHPNIIACKESFLLTPQVLCIVTEFADGGDLRKALQDRATRRAYYSERELVDLIVQLCLALKHLHDRKIIHRDLKPENVFLTRSHVVKLGDFGVATVLSHTLACAETLTGTPYYTSPEICLGQRYNSKTDMWSLGCMLYELATFTHAFNGRSQRQLFENIIRGVYSPVTSVRGSSAYSLEFVALIHDMLQKQPRDRPSVNQLIRRPIILTRIQGFLTERAVVDAMNHTVLHGQHIFHPKKQQPLDKKKVNAVASPARAEVIRRAEAVLMAKKQPPSSLLAPRKKVVAPPPAPAMIPAVKYQPPPSQKKKDAVARVPVRRNSLKATLSARKLAVKKAAIKSPEKPKAANIKSPEPKPKSRPVSSASPAKPKPKASPQVKRDVKASASPSSVSSRVNERVAAFNVQWQAQRQKLLHNLNSPLPPPPKSAKESTPAVMPPPPPPVVAPPPRSQQKSRSSVAMAAAKQREAMRRDILAKKKALPSASPLDDPVILVQNLPEVMPHPDSGRKAVGPSAAVVGPPPPSAQVAEAEASPTQWEDEVAEEEGEDGEEDSPATESQDERSRIEFQRMLLQLQSVVEAPIDADDEDNDDGEADESTDDLPPPPYDASQADDDAPLVLSTSLLQDAAFKVALRAKLGGHPDKASLNTPQHQQALEWLARYIKSINQ
ncbi:hypothetical protein Poli38472_003930 [Pythium oligandrum]|uniref:non-specific serine/threonine protein kinase n=1 Tax=Pythium oligandrum TaxID=41045 RepID=A0A8K1FJK6_PYTOL|nr:hypothetical protein Poli38472_003930 [Pythium oligandrum]|eukprot:TMW66165.1 hypothetical protein Poli38472_003930 [Pythium oligandrum]